ncbi:MAG: type IV pilus secretin PilQ [Gammaproteobacteria bacterium]|nr:type IV pilus secretin PilQ [Gammaproteobacteria bacterium]
MNNIFINKKNTSLLMKTGLAIVLLIGLMSGKHVYAEPLASIESVRYATLPGNRVQIILSMDREVKAPLSFTIDNPARIAFDFANTVSKLAKRSEQIGVGIAQSVTAITAKNRTRVILNLTEIVPYHVSAEGRQVQITLDTQGTTDSNLIASTAANKGNGAGSSTVEDTQRLTSSGRGIRKIDFRRGENGEGRVIVTLSHANIPMDVSEEFGKIVINFPNSSLPDALRQRLDVLDFATPAKTIDSFEQDSATRIEIMPINNNYEHLVYQSDNIVTVELKNITKDELELKQKEKFGFVGERLSLNFQDIPIRAVLQLIADFTDLNVVVSDTVTGNLTLRLKNVPWDQALDIILKSKGLAKRKSDKVMLIAPSEEIAAQEKIDLEAQQAVTELAPLQTAFFTINFAKVTALEAMFKGEKSMLTPRGYVLVDERTNSIMIKDTESSLTEIRRVLTKLDVPVRQVLVESRIVIANEKFKEEFGARFGQSTVNANGNTLNTTSGSLEATDAGVQSALTNISGGGSITPVELGSLDNRLNVNMPVINPSGAFSLAILGENSLIDLELSALHEENAGEIISSPRVITADRQEAYIEQGVEVPYFSATSSGATQVSFKKAVLAIKVTPQITPDDRIILDLQINKDAVGQVFANIPTIDTREVKTQVLVNNGNTVVLGGIYESIKSEGVTKVPFLGDLPLIGGMFRHTLDSHEKNELLIFVTPKVLKDSLEL